LRQFEDGDIRILVTCKTLDEGLNIAKTDVGIVVSSTGSRRQRVQRLGRVLRKKSSERSAYFYYLYVNDTTEEDELLKDLTNPGFDGLINRIDITYNEEAGLFENQHFSEWEEAVVQQMLCDGYDSYEVVEFMRNADRAMLSEDWLMSEDECVAKVEGAKSKGERNYFIAVLMVIRCRGRYV